MDTQKLDAVSLSVRSLSMDAIQEAKSGHPGLPLGCAELGSVLFGEILKHNPVDPSWENRDRFVLSAGHGSMLLYSLFHLCGYGLTLDDVKQFRKVGSLCPGHPEYGYTAGVEATTGPLGQGIAMAVGMAIAETMQAAQFNTEKHKIVDHYTYALVGEGCLMEGVSSEASSLAGHMQLGKLIVFYDENKISIDGSTDIAFSEDVEMRYKSYGWQVLHGSMYDYQNIVDLVEEAKKDNRPSLIMLKSEIGRGAPTVAGTAAAHGAPIGEEGVREAKKFLGLNPDEKFFVAKEAYDYFEEKKVLFDKNYLEWQSLFDAWSKENPALREQWDNFYSDVDVSSVEEPQYAVGDKVATRTAAGAMLQNISAVQKNLVGGSADLQGPNATKLKESVDYDKDHREGRYIHFGVREFAMNAIVNGIQLHGGFRTFCATFMVFSDYMRPAMRLSALMKIPVVYVLTHDSILIGEDGPTHQPIETIASIRAIPNMRLLRPGDAEEAALAWKIAASSKETPVALSLSRQGIAVYAKEDPDWKNTIKCGAYIVKKGSDNPDITVLATGSEVAMALEASEKVQGKTVRVVSVLDRELFKKQPKELRDLIIGNAKRVCVAEAGTSMGWEGFVCDSDDLFCIDRFGESGVYTEVAKAMHFTADDFACILNK